MRAWLLQQDIELQARDFFADRFSEEDLRAVFGDRPVSEFFSWVSPSYRKLGLDRKSLDDDRLIAMMLQQPRFIRRPMIVVNGELLTPQGGSDRIILTLEDRLH